MTKMYSSRYYWIALGLINELNPNQISKLLKTYSHPKEIFIHSRKMGNKKTSNDFPLSLKLFSRFANFDFKKVDMELKMAERHQVQIIAYEDSEYPKQLKLLADPPPFFEIKGKNWHNLFHQGNHILGVVGSRKICNYGIMVTQSLVTPLSRAGCIIVSGGAIGIDQMAHQVCLNENGPSIAVLGSGLGKLYPVCHYDLFEKLCEKGAIMSEFPFMRSAFPFHFPQRNRIIAGLSKGVLVTQARKGSGSLITAKLALEQGKEVMAVPGPIHWEEYFGSNEFIKQGAHVITGVNDILEIMNWVLESQNPVELNGISCKILKALDKGPLSRQHLLDLLEIPSFQLSKEISDLEERELIISLRGERWSTSLKGCEALCQKKH